MTAQKLSRVALVGAGFIGTVHADVLSGMPDTTVAAVVDPVIERAAVLARRCGAAHVAPSIAALGEAVAVDIAHVLTPPVTHRAVAEALLRRGVHVLLEKPMATSERDCAALEQAADAGGVGVTVNHNFIWHPSFARLLHDVQHGAVGPLRHVDVLYMPLLRQLAGGQLNHWMFQSPLNLLLEQVVHPVSQLDALLGPVSLDSVSPGAARCFGGTHNLVTAWQVLGHAGVTSFALAIDLAGSSPTWRVRAVGSDGTLECDVLRNLYIRQLPTPWLEPCDHIVAAAAAGAATLMQAAGNAFAYGLSQTGLARRSDGFFLSMRRSIKRSHRMLGRATAEPLGNGGRRVIAAIERIAAAVDPPMGPRRQARRVSAASCSVILVGGTGFIGHHLVAALIERGHCIRVMARQVSGLPSAYGHPRVDLLQGDVTDEAVVASGIEYGSVVIHLAHGGGSDWPSVARGMVGGASVVATAARHRGAAHLVFASSIAALYLGDASKIVEPETPPDAIPQARSAYARGKIESERLLVAMCEGNGLPVTIVRPGLVVGRGASPFHSGLGEFNRETYCLGWNQGMNALPFVLVSDVVAAMVGLVERPFKGCATHNLVGDVRPTARDYVASLARTTGRPLVYRGRRQRAIAAAERAKWAVKRLGGRDASVISMRDIRSRGLVSQFDTAAVKAWLDWRPEADPCRFWSEAFADVA